ncbi:MAG: methyltransferase [Lachnospiraceae bacterium]|nr:methyltransferase [Lachnospiraceae bacterium]
MIIITRIPFNQDELTVTAISTAFRNANVPVFNYPVSMREGWKELTLNRNPIWLGTGVETFNFYPDIIPDNRARGFVNDQGMRISDDEKGGKDMFGVDWVYVPSAGGSMENPDIPPLFTDANDWEKFIQWPDIDSWDWEGSSRSNKEYLQNDQFKYIPLLNGFGFERLISFMGFEAAAIALIDEDQEDAIKALLERTSDLYCRIIDRCCEAYNIDGFLIHDDWGSQREPFFSVDVGREMIVPYMKKVTDHIHELGKVAELHSCGCNEKQIENFIAAGWDMWSPMDKINDTQKLFDEYGDRIIIGVSPDPFDPETESESEIREKARNFVDHFCGTPGKVCIINRYFAPYLQGAYAEELYKDSRLAYLK